MMSVLGLNPIISEGASVLVFSFFKNMWSTYLFNFLLMKLFFYVRIDVYFLFSISFISLIT